MGLAVWNPLKVADCFSPRRSNQRGAVFNALLRRIASNAAEKLWPTAAVRKRSRPSLTVITSARVPMPLQRRRSKWKRNDRPCDRIQPAVGVRKWAGMTRRGCRQRSRGSAAGSRAHFRGDAGKSACRASFATICAIVAEWSLRIWASSRSRTSPIRSGTSGSGSQTIRRLRHCED